jgi:hypothetical protein
LVRSSVSALTEDAESAETKQCLNYVMSTIVGGFKKLIMFSYKALLKDLGPTGPESRQVAAVPLITTRLELVENDVLFSPPLMSGQGNLYGAFKE